MFRSEILIEKDRVQARLSEEHASIHEYVASCRDAAKEVADTHGFELHYADISAKTLEVTSANPPS